jgi:ankyrin repeat protein
MDSKDPMVLGHKMSEILSREELLDRDWTDGEKEFATRICINTKENHRYIDENLGKIKESISESKIQGMMMILAMSNSTKTKTFKLLKRAWKIDKNYQNHMDNNCLIIACTYNKNLDMIKYLIHGEKFDLNVTNCYRECCLIRSCVNPNVEIFKYLVLLHNMNKTDIWRVNDMDRNMFAYACVRNENLCMIKYLYELLNPLGDIFGSDVVGNDCLILGSGFNRNVQIVKYLVEELKMDPMKKNNESLNCLMFGCVRKNDPSVIKYLVEKVGIEHVDKKENNCLLLAAKNTYENATAIPVLKYLIEGLGMDMNYKNKKGYDVIHMACFSESPICDRPSLEVIAYLASRMDNQDDNHNNVTTYGYDYLMVAAMNPCVTEDVIKFMINDMGMDINAECEDNWTAGHYACKINHGINIIKHLVKKLPDAGDRDVERNNMILNYACQYNKHADVIKWLVKNGYDPNYVNRDGDNCLTVGCWKNKNVEMIKYFICDLKMDVNHKDYLNNNCFLAACMGSKNIELIKYLVESTEVDTNCVNARKQNWTSFVKLDSGSATIDFLINNERTNIVFKRDAEIKMMEYVLLNTRDHRKINQSIESAIDLHGFDCVRKIIEKLNPFILTKGNQKILNINPFVEKSYEECVGLLDALGHRASVRKTQGLSEKNRNKNKNQNHRLNDFTRQNELLFRQGSENYYGHREIVYNAMYLFKDSENLIDFQNPVVLEGDLSKDVMNLYISAMYTGRIDLDPIPSDEFIDFIKFIDQYPGTGCSVDQLENKIIRYVRKHLPGYCEYLVSVCDKYQLKSMYLSIHNEKFQN